MLGIMADPTLSWHEEHIYFRRLLNLLQHEMDTFATGDTPNYQLMRDVIAYLREWGDEWHHPREDEAFRRLMRRQPDRELPIRRLMQEHRVIAHAGDELERMLEEIDGGDAVVPRTKVEIAAATFLVYYGNHIAREEEDILPLALKVLDPDDWAAIKSLPVRGSGMLEAARFRDLRRRIEMEA